MTSPFQEGWTVWNPHVWWLSFHALAYDSHLSLRRWRDRSRRWRWYLRRLGFLKGTPKSPKLLVMINGKTTGLEVYTHIFLETPIWKSRKFIIILFKKAAKNGDAKQIGIKFQLQNPWFTASCLPCSCSDRCWTSRPFCSWPVTSWCRLGCHQWHTLHINFGEPGRGLSGLSLMLLHLSPYLWINVDVHINCSKSFLSKLIWSGLNTILEILPSRLSVLQYFNRPAVSADRLPKCWFPCPMVW